MILWGCNSPEATQSDLKAEVDKWHKGRMERLYAETGFLNLAGLFWMEPGDHTFGSSQDNSLVFPSDFAPLSGKLFVTPNQVVFTPDPSFDVEIDGEPVASPTLIYDKEEDLVKTLVFRSFKWFVIERAGNIGIRLKDLEHPLLKSKMNIGRFDISPEWVVEADYVPYDAPREIRIENIIGHVYDMPIQGQLRFEKDGKKYTLEPIIEGDKFFVIFSDETSGESTYGAGRYMYIDRPAGEVPVVLDFNKSYNPPCAFTEFATCFIPPPENRLSLVIEAGEKDFHF